MGLKIDYVFYKLKEEGTNLYLLGAIGSGVLCYLMGWNTVLTWLLVFHTAACVGAIVALARGIVDKELTIQALSGVVLLRAPHLVFRAFLTGLAAPFLFQEVSHAVVVAFILATLAGMLSLPTWATYTLQKGMAEAAKAEDEE